MKAEGIESVSLCLIPGLGCEEGVPGDMPSFAAPCFGKKHLNFLFDFAGLYHFKSRFRPRRRKPRHLFASSIDPAHDYRAVPHERSLDHRSEENEQTLRPELPQAASATAMADRNRTSGEQILPKGFSHPARRGTDRGHPDCRYRDETAQLGRPCAWLRCLPIVRLRFNPRFRRGTN